MAVGLPVCPKIHVGDRIVGVGEGERRHHGREAGRFCHADSWRGRHRSPSEVLPADAGPDGKHVFISLVRKPISLQDQSAKSSIQTVTDGKATHTIGVITLPSFYEDFAGKQKGTPRAKAQPATWHC